MSGSRIIIMGRDYCPVATVERVGQLKVLKVTDVPVAGVLVAVLFGLLVQTAVSPLTASRAVLLGIASAPTMTGCLATTSYIPMPLLSLFCHRIKRDPAWSACTVPVLFSSIWTGESSSAENVCNVPCSCVSG